MAQKGKIPVVKLEIYAFDELLKYRRDERIINEQYERLYFKLRIKKRIGLKKKGRLTV